MDQTNVSPGRKILIGLLFLAAYFAAGKLGLHLAVVNASASAIWPATGIALAGLLFLGYEYCPVVFLGAFLVNATTTHFLGTSLAVAAGNTLEALVGAYLVNRRAGGREVAERAANLFWFALLGGLAAPVVSASVGVVTLCVGHLAPWSDFRSIWLTWWLGDATGSLILTPFLLLWVSRAPRRRNPLQTLEALLYLGGILAFGQMVFGTHSSLAIRHYPLEFLCLPLLLWGAFRFGPRGTSAGVVLLAGIAVWQTLHGLGPFVRPDLNNSLLLLQAFTGIVSVTSLCVAAVVSERSEKALRLREAFSAAESEVHARTAALLRSHAELEAELHRRLEAERDGQATAERYRLLFERNLAGVCFTTPDGRILECNAAFARTLGYARPAELLSRKMEEFYFDPEERRGMVARLMREGRLNNFELHFRRKDGNEAWILANLTYVTGPRGSADLIEGNILDITRIKNAQDELRRLSANLLRSQDEERRRVARELHDSMGQYLAAVMMNLSQLSRRADLDLAEAAKVRESIALCETCIAEMRTLSHLLHPPLLDEVGLESAVRWYADGFAKRSGIETTVEIAPLAGRMPNAVETALFRILQESLTNIHRHSGSASARIHLNADAEMVVLRVHDEGVGMPDAVLAAYELGGKELGVGIVSMRERVKELGGRLDIRSGPGGTTIEVMLPLRVVSGVDEFSAERRN